MPTDAHRCQMHMDAHTSLEQRRTTAMDGRAAPAPSAEGGEGSRDESGAYTGTRTDVEPRPVVDTGGGATEVGEGTGSTCVVGGDGVRAGSGDAAAAWVGDATGWTGAGGVGIGASLTGAAASSCRPPTSTSSSSSSSSSFPLPSLHGLPSPCPACSCAPFCTSCGDASGAIPSPFAATHPCPRSSMYSATSTAPSPASPTAAPSC
jgi:hypothetical protein